MTDKEFSFCPNAVAAYLHKRPEDFTKADILDYIEAGGIRMVNFMYPSEDGRVKTLNFIIHSREYLETILSQGERVDGSSLFPSFVEAGSSDLYVVPRFRTAFRDPFAEIPTLSMLCSFYDKNGKPFECDPYLTVLKAAKAFREATGMTFEAMGELEYYVISEESLIFRGTEQRGYHESEPFARMNSFRTECMDYISSTGGVIKYGHSEVGNFVMDGKSYEQNEIEFLPCPIETAADQILLAKWVIRNLAAEYGVDVSFAPKITVGEAGSGMHIHMKFTKDGQNCMLSGGLLSETARRAIAGMMVLAPAITAFGNKNPTSYFRLVPHQEAPTNICWGDFNRSALVRVPLGWTSGTDMCADANPLEKPHESDTTGKQTVEMRSPDGSADIYQLMAGLCAACLYGLKMDRDDALAIAGDKYIGLNLHGAGADIDKYEALPDCCEASAAALDKAREIFERDGIFSAKMIDGIIRSLKSFGDKGLLAAVIKDRTKVRALVELYFYCG